MHSPIYLKLYVSRDIKQGGDKLLAKYTESIKSHNQKAKSSHPDAGFDLFCPPLLNNEIKQNDSKPEIENKINISKGVIG